MSQYQAYRTTGNNENTRFQFQSMGKRGIFEKLVYFTPLYEDVYNLSLVDYDPVNGTYDDISVTDNGDMPEILATVITTIYAFLESNPGNKVYFEGSTSARTRLYQISISKVYNPEQSDLQISGYKNEQWFPFEPSIRFEGFLIKKRS